MTIALRTAAAAAALCLLARRRPRRSRRRRRRSRRCTARTGWRSPASRSRRPRARACSSSGGNAVDAACAMLAATSTMWDVLSWGGETQALIYNPKTGKIIAINALGVAPTGATAEFFKAKGMQVPARVRAARRGDAGHARRAHHDARRIRHALARRSARAGDRARRRLSRSKRETADRIEAREGDAQAVALLEGGDAAARRRSSARRRSRARSSARPISPRR